MANLAQEAVRIYEEQGYWLYRRPVFPRNKFRSLCGIFEELLARKGETRADELDTPHFTDKRLMKQGICLLSIKFSNHFRHLCF